MKASLLSMGYRTVRSLVIRSVYKKQEQEGKPRDLEDVVEIGDQLLRKLPSWATSFPIPDSISRKLYDLEFPSPLTLSAFKDDLDIISIWMRLGLGGACVKTIMREPRQGNPRPRLLEVFVNSRACLINAMGLPGGGIDYKIEEFRNSSIFSLGRPIGISIGGSSMYEYQLNFDRLHAFFHFHTSCPHYFEINISCPNTPEGQQMSRNPDLLENLLAYIRKKSNAVLGVKLSPDMHDKDLLSFAERIQKCERTYVNLGNTQAKTCEEAGLSPGSISVGKGGLSGPALYPRTLKMTSLLEPTGIPIIATGGVDSAEKVKELLEAGATLVGMATAVVQDMYCIPKINYRISKMGI